MALKERFTDIFPPGAGVAVYGIGNAAFRVAEILRPHCEIIGYIDRDESIAGQELYDSRIIKLEEAKSANAIIIAANPIYWITIYERLRDFSVSNNIPVYNTDGTLALEQKNEKPADNSLFDVTLAHLHSECEKYSVISFDIFDTLLVRKVSLPDDIFALVSVPVTNFSYRRRQAQTAIHFAKDGVFTLSDVYEHMGIDRRYTEVELETEARFLDVRVEMRDLLLRLSRSGKRVVLVSDMYVPQKWLERQIEARGIVGYERLFLSNTCGATKESGNIWPILKEQYGTDNILHIGDSIDADVLPAKNAGLATFRIMSESEMLHESGLRELGNSAKTLGDRVALGLIQNRLFNNPFALAGSEGAPKIATPFDLGYCVFAPLTLVLLDWIAECAMRSRPSKILFAARDGYLLNNLWNNMRRLRQELPEGIYFPISRRLCTVCSFRNAQDVLDSLNIPIFSGRLDTFFRMRLGIEYRGDDLNKRIRSTDICVIDLVKAHMSQVLESGSIQRGRYLKFINRIISDDEKIALFDIGKFGSCQHLLQEVCKREFTGLYLHYDDTGSNAHLKFNTNAEALFRKSAEDGYETIERRNSFNEAVFTALEGTYLSLDENGNFVTDEVSANTQIWDGICGIHAGIAQFIEDCPTQRNRFPISKTFAAKTLDLISAYQIKDAVSNLLQFDDIFMGMVRRGVLGANS
ncbi:MAG: HAD-IA family hydrolase [Zoogloeaceae bacterium]|nr:HAD-IA family hydrolase [Zoogloeaceae bacterium]